MPSQHTTSAPRRVLPRALRVLGIGLALSAAPALFGQNMMQAEMAATIATDVFNQTLNATGTKAETVFKAVKNPGTGGIIFIARAKRNRFATMRAAKGWAIDCSKVIYQQILQQFTKLQIDEIWFQDASCKATTYKGKIAVSTFKSFMGPMQVSSSKDQETIADSLIDCIKAPKAE
jgi:hypothetical protein